MRLIKPLCHVLPLLLILSCAKGGPLTPMESFEEIKRGIDAGDSTAILKHLSSGSINKIDSLDRMVRQMGDEQLLSLAKAYGCEPASLKKMKRQDYVSLYFFVKHGREGLAGLFNQQVVTVDVDGPAAIVRVQCGIELGFVREGPYWKLDISDL